MGQAITDYGKFLAEAREAVDSLNCDQNTYDQLAAEEIRLERELEAAKKAVADNISQTTRKRRDEISSDYDQEIGKGQERLKKARAKREKEKNRGMKERIADETSELREHNRELKLQMRTMFQQAGVPGLCNSTFYYALFYPRGAQGDSDLSGLHFGLLSGHSLRVVFPDTGPEDLVSGGDLLYRCGALWRALCDGGQPHQDAPP